MADKTIDSYRVLCEMSKTLKDIFLELKKISTDLKTERMQSLRESKKVQLIENLKSIPEDRKDPNAVVRKILAS